MVESVRPWGLDVTLPGGTPGLIDIAKDPAWPAAGQRTTAGTALRVVVLDDQRVPMRLSALADDLDIARAKRAELSDADRRPPSEKG